MDEHSDIDDSPSKPTKRLRRTREGAKALLYKLRRKNHVMTTPAIELEVIPLPAPDNAAPTPTWPGLRPVDEFADYDWASAFANSPGIGAITTSPQPAHGSSSRQLQEAAARAREREAKATVAAKASLYKNARELGGTSRFELGHGWTRFVHFMGYVYYYNHDLHTVTRDNIEDEEMRKAVEEASIGVRNALEQDGLEDYIPEDCEIIIGDEAETAVAIHHPARRIYDTGPEDPSEVLEVRTMTTDYWDWAEQFPMHLEYNNLHSVEDMFLNALTYGANVRVLEDKDNDFPYTDEQIAKIMRTYRQQRVITTGDMQANCSFNWHIARLLREVQSARTLSPRKGCSSAVKAAFDFHRVPKKHRSSWQLEAAEYLLAGILLGAHKLYFGRLKNVRMGPSVHLTDFRDTVRSFLNEWSNSNLLATVFVGANIAFQQVPNISGLQKTASLASSIFALLSAGTGVHHVWQHRAHVNTDIMNAVKYLNHMRDDYLDAPSDMLETDLLVTSAFLSVPFSALLWSMLCFTIALAALCIQSTISGGRVLLALTMAIFGLVALATWWFFRHIWKASRSESEVSAPHLSSSVQKRMSELYRRRTRKPDEESTGQNVH